MLINNFKNSGSAEGAVNYILSMYDHNGKLRSVEPRVLDGDPQLTKDICNNFCGHLKHKTVSGVISFRDNENPTEEQKKQVIEEFKNTFLGKMKNKCNCVFVEHTDKGNVEIHYVINRIELNNVDDMKDDFSKSGRYFNPFPPGKHTKELMKLFSENMNNKFGFEQVKEDPLKIKLSQNELKCIGKEKHGIKNLTEKVKICEALEDMVKNGMLKNRKELVEFLKDEGFKIERLGEDYLSIKNPNPDGRNIRFKGGIFAEHNGLDYKEVKELAKNKPKQSKEVAQDKLDKLVEKRGEYYKKRFGVKAPKQITKKDDKTKTDAPPGSGQKGGSVAPIKAVEPSKTAIEPTFKDKPQVAPTDHSKGSTDSPEPSIGVSVNHGLASAQANYDNALATLRNAKTHIERIRAQQALYAAKIALDRAQEADRDRFKI
jgi:hypothetical protein